MRIEDVRLSFDERRAVVRADKSHFWHPFTPMAPWTAPDHEPLVLVAGDGAYLIDSEGGRYLDGNASIWTNIHGHGHPHLVRAIERQARRLAHASTLGFTNPPAATLAAKLCALFPPDTLTKVFFTDDGSTAIECALRLALEYHQLTGHPERRRFLAFDQAYHGDTAGAASLGGIGLFQQRFRGIGMPVRHVDSLERLTRLDAAEIAQLAAVTIEPLIQGAAGMRLWPPGMLADLQHWCREHDVLLILDEVMTGFGRTGKMFACQQEGVVPDFLALAKGLSGGTMPLAATLTTQRVYEAFLGRPEEGKTFYYGHSYAGNPLGCAAALANLEVFENEKVLAGLPAKIGHFGRLLKEWQQNEPHVAGVRQLGLIAGIDIAGPDGRRFPPEALTGAKICLSARRHGLLTRPVLDTLVLMPPLCVDHDQLTEMVAALAKATAETLASREHEAQDRNSRPLDKP